MTRTEFVRVGHDVTETDRLLRDAQRATYEQIERARDARRYRPPAPPAPAPTPAKTSRTKPAAKTPVKTAAPAPSKIEVPPGHLLLNPKEVAMFRRLVDSHPLVTKVPAISRSRTQR